MSAALEDVIPYNDCLGPGGHALSTVNLIGSALDVRKECRVHDTARHAIEMLGNCGRRARSLLALTVLGLAAIGSGAAMAEMPRMLACTFQDGGAWSFEKGAFAPKTVVALSFVMSDIDEKSMTARLEDKDRASPLRMVQAVEAHHFIEVGVEGFLNLTTVYEKMEGDGWPAVHSRHVAVLGEPMVSQYRGLCRPK